MSVSSMGGWRWVGVGVLRMGSKAVSGGVEKIGKVKTRPWFVSYFATHRLGVPLAPLVFLPPRSLH